MFSSFTTHRKPLNFQPTDQQQTEESEETNMNDDKDTSRNDVLSQDNDDFQPRYPPFMKPFQMVRLNKQAFEQ